MAKFFFTQVQNVELIVEGGQPRGGSVIETMVWMKALNELGHEILLAKFSEDKRSQLEHNTWVNLISLYDSRAFKRRLVWFTYRFPRIYSTLKEYKPDIVYTSIPTWHVVFVGLICRVLGIKHVIRVANDPDVDSSLMPDTPQYQNRMRDIAYRLADLVVAQNKFQYETLKRKFPKTRVEKLFNPIELDQRFLQSKQGMEGYIAWLANFRHQKNLKLLYEVAIELPNESFKVGGQPLIPLDEETEEYIGRLRELPNVQFVGVVPRNEVLEFLFQAKFLLSTSRYEGFSNTFLESMVVGTPIVTTKTVNPDGIVTQFDLGLVYQDAEDLSVTLSKISLESYTQKSMNCVEFVKKHHDHLELGRKLLSYLE